MIVVLERGAEPERIEQILAKMESLGLTGRLLPGPEKPMIHVIAGPTRRVRKLQRMERVLALVATSGPRVRRHGRRFYPYHFLGWSAAVVALLGLLVVLAGHYPPGVGDAIDLRGEHAEVSLPWYLLAPKGVMVTLSSRLGWTFIILSTAVLFLVPALDRLLSFRPWTRWPLLGAGLLMALAFVFMSFRGWIG